MSVRVPDKLRRALQTPWLPFVLLFLVQLACHLLLNLDAAGGDDAYYSAVMEGEGLWNLAVRHYHVWSARTLLEWTEAIICTLPPLVWRLVNPAMITLCAVGIVSLCGAKGDARVRWAVCALLLVYPWPVLASAGWRVTTVVYVWTAAALCGALVPAARLARGEQVGRGWALACVPLTLYAVNMEQVLVWLLAALVLFFAYRLIRRQGVPWVVVLQIGLCFAMLAYTGFSPGVQQRFEIETTSAFVDFAMVTFFSKLEMGVSSALLPLVYGRDFIFDGFCLLLALGVWQHNRRWWLRVLGLFPAVVSLLFSYASSLMPFTAFFSESLNGNNGIITLATHSQPLRWLPLVLLYLVFVVCLVDVYLALGHRPLSLVCAGVVVCGLLSRATMGFSPTIISSGARTGFYFSLSLIAAAALLLREMPRDKPWPWLGVYGYTGIFAAWRTLGFLRH